MYKIINIKKDNPTTDYALHMLDKEIEFATIQKINVIIAIHGYGSNGENSQIKAGSVSLLNKLKKHNKIIDFVPGEKWGATNELVVKMEELYPSLVLCNQITNLNNGVTIIWVCR